MVTTIMIKNLLIVEDVVSKYNERKPKKAVILNDSVVKKVYGLLNVKCMVHCMKTVLKKKPEKIIMHCSEDSRA